MTPPMPVSTVYYAGLAMFAFGGARLRAAGVAMMAVSFALPHA